MIIVKHSSEHTVLPEIGNIKPFERSDRYPDGLLLNPHASSYDQKYFFVWENEYQKTPCYTSTYIIGAQWIDGEALIIEPKMKDIDFMRMFSVCLSSDLSPELFAKIYSVDLDAKPIKTNTKLSVALTPMMIVHFLLIMKRITTRGLRSDYIGRNENCKKVKGRIDIRNNERKNIINRRYDKVYCNYSERSTNIPENRLFKKTLLICKRYISHLVDHELYSSLLSRINICLSVFEGIDENIELQEIRAGKRNNLYKDYAQAVDLALKIVKKIDVAVTTDNTNSNQVPAFWIDMALLYEHYVYGLLHRVYGSCIKYQYSGHFGWKPDFLHTGEKLIMDAKYIPAFEYSGISGDIAGQLSGYSRVNSFTDVLGVDEDTVVPCVIIYPCLRENSDEVCFDKQRSIIEQATAVKHLVKFYKIGVPVPMLSESKS